MPIKPKRMKRRKQTKITKSAKGEDCLIRIPGHCTFNNEQTVLCHLGGAGVGTKRSNHEAAYGCFGCHQVIDGAVQTDYSANQIKVWFYDAVMRTQERLIEKGLIVINE